LTIKLYTGNFRNMKKINYTKILKGTQGAWGKASPKEKKAEKKRRKLELEATARMKKAW